MKYVFRIFSFALSVAALLRPVEVFSQKETFDIVTYTSPKTWQKKISASAVQFTKEDAAKGTYCSITLFKSVPGTTDAKGNFDAAWESIVKEMVTASTDPTMQPAETDDGWEVQSGYAAFENDGNKGIVILVTSTGFQKMVNALILTNTDVYEKNVSDFLGSISLKKPKVTVQQQPATNNSASVVGTWGVSTTTASFYNTSMNEGSIITQYTFKANGTYSFYIKTFRYLLENLLLTRETGTYQVSGNNITISPQKSAVESWSKKNGTDDWGKLLSSQKRGLEKVTYQFVTEDYGSGMVLVLKAPKETKRDGYFNNSQKDAWFYPAKSPVEFIKLPGGEQVAIEEKPKKPVKQTATVNNAANNTDITGKAVSDGYTFNTTNFDDGWTSTVQEDWVEATKGTIRVLIHYPNKKADEYTTDLLQGLKNAWNILVAPKYSTMGNVEFRPLHNWEAIEFAEADAVESATGKSVHVVLFKKNYSGGGGKYLEFVTPDKNSFVHEFGAFNESASSWEKVEKMGNYNKFAVAAADLKGKWTSDFTGAIQYVNAYTGADAGMNTHASNENYHLGPGNTYTWDLGVASGRVGNIKFQSVKSSGKFSMIGNWQIHFSDIEGKPRTYAISFTCIKGLRILWIDGKAFAKAG